MLAIDAVDLSTVIVSVANSVSEANRILNEGSDVPMGVTEFSVTFKVHASLQVTEPRPVGVTLGEGRLPTVSTAALRPMATLRNFMTLSPRERILSGFSQEADLTISAKIEPMPKVD